MISIPHLQSLVITGGPVVAGCTSGARVANSTCGTILIFTKDKLQSETCVMNAIIIDNDVTKSHSPYEDIPKVIFDIDSSGGGEDSVVTFSGFLDPGGRITIKNESVHVIICPALSNQMLRAATVVLNILISKELHPIPVLLKIALSLLGCMYLASPPSHHSSGLKVHQLSTESNKLIKLTPLLQSSGHEETCKRCSLLTEATVPQSILTNFISSHEIEREIIVFRGGAIDNPPIRPLVGVVWQRIPVSEGMYVHISD